ncbi:hypothetical protein Q7P37_002452 [Cladosporium fusiforme]
MAASENHSGGRYSHVSASNQARLHAGNVYNVTTHNYSGRKLSRRAKSIAGPRKGGEDAWVEALYEWLVFSEINDRRERVCDAHRRTFRWIFEEDNTTGFADWLQHGHGIYWIKGKPASGKSTLMKFITHEPHLRAFLDTWTGDLPLVIASFWFWAAGSKLQRSLVGLYRTILYRILKTERKLCRIAFPDWRPKFAESAPSMSTLTEAMKNILSQDVLSANFCFVIDGLDEYDRDSIGKTQLATLMLDLTRSTKVKILLSSRPEVPFENAFRGAPGICLESLTSPDISAYIHSRLWTDPGIREMSHIEEDEARKLSTMISRSAQGVFLWVALALDIIIDCINNHDHFEEIHHRVAHLPPELDDLFTHILLKRIPQQYTGEVFRYLYMVLKWHAVWGESDDWTREGAPAVALCLGQQASSYKEAIAIAQLDSKEIVVMIEGFQSRLKSRCHGLLEYATSPARDSVAFLHRTLFDYLNQYENSQNLIRSKLGGDFDVFVAMIAGLTASLTYARAGRHLRGLPEKDIRSIFHWNALAEQSTGRHLTELLWVVDGYMSDMDSVEASSPTKREEVHSDETRSDHWTNSLNDCGPEGGVLLSDRPPQDDYIDSYVMEMIIESNLRNGKVEYNSSATSCDLLAYTIYTGASLYLRQAIASAGKLPHKEGQPLLRYAVLPQPCGDESAPTLNMEAAAILLENGAEPMRVIDKWSPWLRALLYLVKTCTGGRSCPHPNVSQLLDLMRLLASHAGNDLKLCRDTSELGYTASQAIEEFVLGAECCPGKIVERCVCAKAQEWKPRAMSVLHIINPARVTRERSFFLTLKGIFSS